MGIEILAVTKPDHKLYFGLSRTKALEVLWDKRDKEAQARGTYRCSRNQLFRNDEERIQLMETAANFWALCESEVKEGKQSDIQIAEGMATMLEGYRHDKDFIQEISNRVDELNVPNNLKLEQDAS